MPAWLHRLGANTRMQHMMIFLALSWLISQPQIWSSLCRNQSLMQQKIDSMYPNQESMPRKTMAMKKHRIHRLGHGRIASAFGKILKLRAGPDRVSSSIVSQVPSQKCPRYMKTFMAHIMPQITMLKGIRQIPIKYFSFLGFMLDRLMIPEHATVIWQNTCTIASIHISTLNSLDQLGVNRQQRPAEAPGRNNPRISKMEKKKYGINAVNMMILPELLTPFLITRQQIYRLITYRKNRGRSKAQKSPIESDCLRTTSEKQ